MTEQEFIDKYCCTDNHAEYCNDDCTSCERKFKKDLEVIKEKIKADAIDKFVDLCEESKTCMFGQGTVDMRDIRKIAELLKEQNNESKYSIR